MKHNFKNFCLAFPAIFILSFSVPAQAQLVKELSREQDWITRNHHDRIEEEQRHKEKEEMRQEREEKEEITQEIEARKEKKVKIKTPKKPQPQPQSKCPVIKNIDLPDKNLFSEDKKDHSSLLLGKCLEMPEKPDLVLSDNPIAKNRNFLKTQKEKKWLAAQKSDSLEGQSENIEHDLSSEEEEFVQYEEEQTKTSDTKKNLLARAKIGHNNLGTKFSGIRRTNIGGGLGNVFLDKDSFNLDYVANLNDNNKIRDYQSVTASASLPFGPNTFSYTHARSEFKARDLQATRVNGYSSSHNFNIDHTLLKKDDLRLAANASLTRKESQSYLAGNKIIASERNLSIGSVGLTILSNFKNGAELHLKPSFAKGLKILGAKQDPSYSTAAMPKAQFEAFKLYGSLSKKFVIPNTAIPFTLATEMEGQIARDILYGSEQFSVGGYHSVRGFREDYIDGDSGYYFRNKANFNVGSLVMPLMKEKSDSGFFANLNKFQLEPFYDYGYAKTSYGGDSGRLSGTGIKTIFTSQYFNASLTYSRQINRSSLINFSDKENNLVYFEVSALCCK
ncbi:MAG: exported protein of unknown function [Rickettsiaceae bacterium]|nr:exported protein of unknown function [Rickettsiaceae bacterium]